MGDRHEGRIRLGAKPYRTCLAKDAASVRVNVSEPPDENGARFTSLIGNDAKSSSIEGCDPYPQAIRHGFTLAGLSNQIFENCNYRDPADRIAFIDRLRATMIAQRTEAIALLFRYFRKRPPYVHSNVDIDALTRNGKGKLARMLFEGCHSRQHPGNISFNKLNELPFGYVISCPNALPRDFGGADFPLRLGFQTWLDISDEYDRHVPASGLMTEDVIGSLAGSPIAGRQ